MSATCLQDALLQAVASALAGLNLTFEGRLLTIQVLKEPKARDWDNLPVLQVAPAEGGKWERLFGSSWLVPYGIEVALLAAGNRDLVSNLSAQLGWRNALQRLLAEPEATGLTSVSCVTVNEDPPLDRSQIPDGYDASVIYFIFTCLEDH